jgi:hypothetical protein
MEHQHGPWCLPFCGIPEITKLHELALSWEKGKQDLREAIARAKNSAPSQDANASQR